MLVEAARRMPGMRRSPAAVIQTALSDFYPEYRLVCRPAPRIRGRAPRR